MAVQETTAPEPVAAGPATDRRLGASRYRTLRRIALGGYAVAFITGCVISGIPLDRLRVVLWVCAALACVSIGRPWRAIPRLIADWLPFTLALVVYDFSRGAADTLGAPIHYTPQLEFDRFLFGGTVPTVWLQQHLVTVDYIRWYEVPLTVVYMSHFIAPITVAGVFWARNRLRFVGYAKRFVTLAFVGCATYIAFPAAPPWLAAQEGYLPDLLRTSGRGFEVLHLSTASRLLEQGQATANSVAAVPSLHAAFSALVALALWPTASRRWRAVLAAYPVAMGFTLVITGEHYVFDILLGWVYAAAVIGFWHWLDQRRSA